MSARDAKDEIGERFRLPVSDPWHGRRRVVNPLQLVLLRRDQDLLHREVCRTAGLFERLVTTAAIDDTQFFKDSRGSGVFQRQFPHSFLSGYAHCILLTDLLDVLCGG